MNAIYAALAIGGAMGAAGCLAIILGTALGEWSANRTLAKWNAERNAENPL